MMLFSIFVRPRRCSILQRNFTGRNLNILSIIGLPLRIFLPFPHQKIWPVFQFWHKGREFLTGQNQGADFAFDVAFSFSAQIIQVVLVDVSNQQQVNDTGIFPLGIIINDVGFFQVAQPG